MICGSLPSTATEIRIARAPEEDMRLDFHMSNLSRPNSSLRHILQTNRLALPVP